MGVGFALNPRLRYCVSLHTPHSFTNSPLCLSSPSEETFADYEALRLEKAIILQLEKLGALKLFNVCLSRSLGTSPVSDYADKVNDYKDKVVVQSRKRKENKTRRENLLPRQFHPSH
ncbi:hypothetical protein AAZV13_14G119950 [Glycine max]